MSRENSNAADQQASRKHEREDSPPATELPIATPPRDLDEDVSNVAVVGSKSRSTSVLTQVPPTATAAERRMRELAHTLAYAARLNETKLMDLALSHYQCTLAHLRKADADNVLAEMTSSLKFYIDCVNSNLIHKIIPDEGRVAIIERTAKHHAADIVKNKRGLNTMCAAQREVQQQADAHKETLREKLHLMESAYAVASEACAGLLTSKLDQSLNTECAVRFQLTAAAEYDLLREIFYQLVDQWYLNQQIAWHLYQYVQDKATKKAMVLKKDSNDSEEEEEGDQDEEEEEED